LICSALLGGFPVRVVVGVDAASGAGATDAATLPLLELSAFCRPDSFDMWFFQLVRL